MNVNKTINKLCNFRIKPVFYIYIWEPPNEHVLGLLKQSPSREDRSVSSDTNTGWPFEVDQTSVNLFMFSQITRL